MCRKQNGLKGFIYFFTVLFLIFGAGNAFAFHGNESINTENPREAAQTVTQSVETAIKNKTVPSVGSGVGISAGDSEMLYGLWADISYNSYNFDGLLPNGNRDDNDTDLWVGIVGIDRVFGKFLIGLAINYENTSTDFTTNFYTSETESDGYSIIPYVAFKALDWLVLDAMYSYTQTDNDITISGMPGWDSDSYDSRRHTFAANINVYHEIGSFLLNPYIGYLYSDNEQDAIDAQTVPAGFPWATEFTSYFGQWRLGLGGNYAFTDSLEGYASIAYLNESTFGGTNTNPDRDDDEGEGTLGLSYYISNAFTLRAEAAFAFGRDDTDSWRSILNLTYSF